MLPVLRHYIDTSVPPEVRRNPEQAYLQLQQRLRVRAERLPELDAWLHAHNS